MSDVISGITKMKISLDHKLYPLQMNNNTDAPGSQLVKIHLSENE